MLGMLDVASSVMGSGSGPLDTGSAISSAAATQTQTTGSFAVGGAAGSTTTWLLLGVVVSAILWLGGRR